MSRVVSVTVVLLVATASGGSVLPVTSDPVEIAPGVLMPRVNLGTCCGSDPSVGLQPWLDVGGVGIDTAWDYNDQPAIASVLAKAAVKRSKLFITTKIPGTSVICNNVSTANVMRYITDDLTQLNTSFADLILLHEPCAGNASSTAKIWQTLEHALTQNLTRSIGVSNFALNDLVLLNKTARVKPSVNQCQMPPGPLLDPQGFAYCQKNGILYESYGAMKGCRFNDTTMLKMAATHNVSVSQVCLRWVLQMGAVVAVGTGTNASTTRGYAAENLNLFTFNLTQHEMDYISAPAPTQPPTKPPPSPPTNPITKPPTKPITKPPTTLPPSPSAAPTAAKATSNPLNGELAAALFSAVTVAVLLLIFLQCKKAPPSMYTAV
eukprot:m.414365 g.414365  ORF g.414365 m.414365 type:complete len:378 (+) comp29331_c0_seq1:36-1169(+)